MNWKFWANAMALRRQLDGAVVVGRELAKRAKAAEAAGLIRRAKPMGEAQLLEKFRGAKDDPLLEAMCQVIDESYDYCTRRSREGDNTVKQTDMMLGGAEALDHLKANLLAYVERAVESDQATEEAAKT